MSNLINRSFDQFRAAVDMPRSSFNTDWSVKTTFNQGELVPLDVTEILPGDSWKVNLQSLVRMSTPVFPVLDNANIDIYSFFVPSRILWDHWKEFNGENTTAPWTQDQEYYIPQVDLLVASGKSTRETLDGLSPNHCKLWNYFNLPEGFNPRSSGRTSHFKVNALPFRAYYRIYDEWFRSESLSYPLSIATDDVTVQIGKNLPDGYKFGDVVRVSKYPDVFTTSLPSPQKGPSVLLPLGAYAPVAIGDDRENQLVLTGSDANTMKYRQTDGSLPSTGSYDVAAYNYGLYQYSGSPSGEPASAIVPSNLYTDLSLATAATVNQLRQAFATQRLYERDTFGTRYREMIKSHFGVTVPDDRVQVPEFLGSYRTHINCDSIVQTSSTDSTSPQGNVAGYSVTHNGNHLFTKSFVEHGYVLTLACVRVEHSYSQGLAKMWSRERRFDFYYPALANLGNMPVKNKEIFADFDPDKEGVNNGAFGYQEAWYDYRFKPNCSTGDFKAFYNSTSSKYDIPLSPWVYSDIYSSLPVLSHGWITEGSENVDRTLAVSAFDSSSGVPAPQFIADFFFDTEFTRVMPVYSVPGLIDHH